MRTRRIRPETVPCEKCGYTGHDPIDCERDAADVRAFVNGQSLAERRAELDRTMTAEDAAAQFTALLGTRTRARQWAQQVERTCRLNRALSGWWHDVAELLKGGN